MEKDSRRPAGCILYSCRCIHFLGSRLHPANYPACARSDSGYRHIAYKRRRFLPQPAHRSAKRQRYDDGIPYHHRQPGTPGVDFLNKLVEVYNEEGNNDKNEVAAKTAEFIDERIRIINKELGTTESQLASFKQRAGVVDITADASQAATEQAGYERAYAENEVQISLVNHLKSHILNEANQYEVIPANIGLNNSDLNTVVQNYNQMLIERKRLLRTSHEDNPAVQSLNASIDVMRNSVMAAIQTAEKGLLINRQALQAQTRKYAGKVSDAPVQEKEYLSISRQQEIQANLYLMLLQKREENNITLASTANNARVIDEPLAGGQFSLLPPRPTPWH